MKCRYRPGTTLFNGLYRRMVAADLVLIAAPAFCWGFPAPIKGLLDRMFCMMDYDGERPGALGSTTSRWPS